jgi:hypothetical protein
VWARIGGIEMSIFETLKKYGKSKNNAIAEAIPEPPKE